MVQKASIILLLSCINVCAFAQGLRSFDYYFGHPSVSQGAKEYYANMFDVNASNKTYSILDSAFTENNDTRHFYIYLICKMLPEASPQLLKEINVVCKYLIENHPGDVTDVLFAGKSYVSDRYKILWAHRVAVELRVTCNAELLSCFKESRNNALQHFHGSEKPRLEALYNLVRRDMNLFQQR